MRILPLTTNPCRPSGWWGPLALVASALAACTGCTVGQGTGQASGRLYALNCSPKGDYCDSTGYCGVPTAPAAYDLAPSFFAGEPIENLNRDLNGNEWVGSASRVNRVTIRLQRSGRQIENNDTLFVDVLDSYEVARCVRGREVVAADGSRQHDYDDRYCYRASSTGPARIRISVVKGIAHASLSPRDTCSRPAVATADDDFTPGVDAEPVAGGAYRSWVEFKDFGSAAQDDVADPTARTPINPEFKIGLNQRLNATAFSLDLVDQKVETARIALQTPPDPDIGGALTGMFDFDLARGQGAQMFP
jgi:hypothetical protein